MFDKIKGILCCWGLQIDHEKRKRGDSINYLGHKIGLQKTQPQKIQIRREQLQTHKNFKILLSGIK